MAGSGFGFVTLIRFPCPYKESASWIALIITPFLGYLERFCLRLSSASANSAAPPCMESTSAGVAPSISFSSS